MSHLNRNLGFRFQDSELRLIHSTSFLRQLTLLSTPVEDFPGQKKPGHRDLLRKHLADISRLSIGHDHRQIWNILELLDTLVVFRLLYMQARGLQRRTPLQRASQCRFRIDAGS